MLLGPILESLKKNTLHHLRTLSKIIFVPVTPSKQLCVIHNIMHSKLFKCMYVCPSMTILSGTETLYHFCFTCLPAAKGHASQNSKVKWLTQSLTSQSQN